MEGFDIIDSHIHLTRNLEEESNYWLFPRRRACDWYGTPERAIEYFELNNPTIKEGGIT